MKSLFIILVCFLLSLNTYAQVTIYFEDFTGQDGKGAIGPTPTIDLSGVDWTVDVSSATLSTSDWFFVTNEIFEARDLDGPCIWQSPIIDISIYKNVSFSLLASEDGSMEAGDYVHTEYRTDGGVWTSASSNGYLSDDFTNALVSQSGLSGNSLEIRVTIENGVGTEYHRFDDVEVLGTLIIPSINLSSISGNTDESGTTATFDVTLETQPGSNVVLNIMSEDTSENIVSSSTLLFTSVNYNVPQTITLTGVDDIVLDGDITTIITIATDGNSDSDYLGLSDTVYVVNIDDEYPLVINEILADPAGDANGDGTTDNSEDEFIELVNISMSDIDISGFTISDNSSMRHEFPAGSIIPAGGVITLFGGGTPTGIPGLVQTAGYLGLNNTGDVIKINDGTSDVITVSYGSEGDDNQSLARSPDYTGSFVKHSTITTNPVAFSPGLLNEGNSPLPVELLFFTAMVEDYSIKLQWATATEENNAYFEIERSLDGINFESIGQVEGSGTTYDTQEYSYIDESPINATNYYRLKQVDLDSEFEIHEVIAVNFEANENDIDVFSVFGGNQIDVIFRTTNIEEIEIDIFNVNGQLLKSLDIYNESNRLTIDISDLEVGVYFLRAIVNKKVFTTSFVKI